MFVSDALWLSGAWPLSEANGSVAGNNSNATGPAAATSVDGLSESQHVTLLELYILSC